MRLTTRILLLTLACLVPTIILAAFVELDQRSERRAQLDVLVMRQADLLNGDVNSIALGTRNLLITAAEFTTVQDHDARCSGRLTSVKRDLPSYAFLAVLDMRGRLVCASTPSLNLPAPPAAPPTWVSEALASDGFATGGYSEATGIDGPFVPFFLPLLDAQGHRHGSLVAALDLNWLGSHLADLESHGSHLLHNSVLSVADRDGVVLARTPLHSEFVGKRFPAPVLPLITAPEPGVTRINSLDGTQRLIGYVPATQSGSGLLVTTGFFEPDLLADINRATIRDTLLLIAAALVATALALSSARRFIGRPTAELVTAAQRWRAGDLGVRANVPEGRSEFGLIASAWNELADTVEQRERQLLQQAQTLESRVEERTRALSETNNRLQVEIAERQETEATLVQAQKLQTMGQLAGGIAHDFNNLLATILGSLELIGRDLRPDQARLKTKIDRASEAVQRGAHLTGRLLAFSRRKQLAVQATDINKLIGDLATLLSTTTLGRRIRVEMTLDPALWPAMAEPSQVEAAILNLAINARDAMPSGGVLTIATACEIVSEKRLPTDPDPGEYVTITLRDTGEGMSDDVARRSFEPFFTTKGASGSGLGLSQVLALSREAAGGVRLQTKPNYGTSVTLLLPRAKAAPAVPVTDTKQRCARKWSVLLVDDDEAVRQVTADMLMQLGCRVQQACDGAEALTILAETGESHELLLVDYAMPGMNGLALVAAARNEGFSGPVVLATGYADAAAEDQEEASPDAILNKPFTGDELARVLSRLAVLARRQQTTEALQPGD